MKKPCNLLICKVFSVARQGLEPRHSDPESDVLPLYYRAMGAQNYKQLILFLHSFIIPDRLILRWRYRQPWPAIPVQSLVKYIIRNSRNRPI